MKKTISLITLSFFAAHPAFSSCSDNDFASKENVRRNLKSGLINNLRPVSDPQLERPDVTRTSSLWMPSLSSIPETSSLNTSVRETPLNIEHDLKTFRGKQKSRKTDLFIIVEDDEDS